MAGYVLRGLDNNAGFGTRLWGLTLEVARMVHQCRRPISNSCVVGSKSTIGLIRGETLWVCANSSGDRGGRARVRQHSGLPPSPAVEYRSRSQSYLPFIICSHSRVHSFWPFSAHAFIEGGTMYILQLLAYRDNKREEMASQCKIANWYPKK